MSIASARILLEWFAAAGRSAGKALWIGSLLAHPRSCPFITCDLQNGDLITANAKLGGAVYWITYRTPSEIGRPQFVAEFLHVLGFEGAAEACVLNRRPAECWVRGEETLQIPLARDPAERWVAIHEDLAYAD